MCLPLADIRSLPDVAMTGNCSQECSELGHSDACWMPGQPSPVRKTRNPPKLSTFVPYQERGSLGRLANGSVRLGGDENRPRLPPSRSAYSSSDHNPSDHAPLEEVPLSVTSEFPPTSPPSNHASKREIYLWDNHTHHLWLTHIRSYRDTVAKREHRICDEIKYHLNSGKIHYCHQSRFIYFIYLFIHSFIHLFIITFNTLFLWNNLYTIKNNR